MQRIEHTPEELRINMQGSRLALFFVLPLWVTGIIVLLVSLGDWGHELYTYILVQLFINTVQLPKVVLASQSPTSPYWMRDEYYCLWQFMNLVSVFDVAWFLYGNVVFWRTAQATVSTALYKYSLSLFIIQYIMLATPLVLMCCLKSIIVCSTAIINRLEMARHDPGDGLPLERIHEFPRQPVPVDHDDVCCICLADYTLVDEVLVLPNCKHLGHYACMEEWLHRKSICPLCRNEVGSSLNV
jgi:hypothetical protein